MASSSSIGVLIKLDKPVDGKIFLCTLDEGVVKEIIRIDGRAPNIKGTVADRRPRTISY